MPPQKRRLNPDVARLEEELNTLAQRQREIRQRIRRMRNSETEVRKLEEKLQKQLSTAKWTAGQIKELRDDWDELQFYHSVVAKPPAPRGRRKRTVSESSGSA